MIRIEPEAWAAMVAHARETYPNECVGAMLGYFEGDAKTVSAAIRLENAYPGAQRERYELRPQDLVAAELEAGRRDLGFIGIYHSHPDCDAYFSKTDLENSCGWLAFVVISIRRGEFSQATCWLPNPDRTEALPEELIY